MYKTKKSYKKPSLTEHGDINTLTMKIDAPGDGPSEAPSF